MKILFLTGSWADPSSRYRVIQFADPMRALGHDVELRVSNPSRYWKSQQRSPIARRLEEICFGCARVFNAVWRTRDLQNYDLVFMNRDLLPEVRFALLEQELLKRGRRVIFDFDDAIYLKGRDKKIEKLLRLCHTVIAGNAYLAEYARAHCPNVLIWPTVVDTAKFCPVKARAPGVFRVGWSGSADTLRAHVPMLKQTMINLAKEIDFEFVLSANHAPDFSWEGVRIRYLPWSPDAEVVNLQQMDVGLMPLSDSEFERGKCGLKAIQYMACGIPALVSPVGANGEIVTHGMTGYHCRTSDEWCSFIKILALDEKKRGLMGAMGRDRVEQFYSLCKAVAQMDRVFRLIGSEAGS